MKRAAAEPDNKARLDAILDSVGEPLCAAQAAPVIDNQAGMTEPSDNGWVGVYLWRPQVN